MELRHINYPAIKTNPSPVLRTKLGAGLRAGIAGAVWGQGGGELAQLPGQAGTVAAHIPTGLAHAVAPASMSIFDNK